MVTTTATTVSVANPRRTRYDHIELDAAGAQGPTAFEADNEPTTAG